MLRFTAVEKIISVIFIPKRGNDGNYEEIIKMGIKRIMTEKYPGITDALLAVYNHVPFNNRASIKGTGNKIQIKSSLIHKTQIMINGDNNSVEIGKYARIYNSVIRIIGSNNTVKLDDLVFMKHGDVWVEGNGSVVHAEENTTFANVAHLIALEGSSIWIGGSTLFAADVFLRTGDSHAVLDMKNGKRTNFAKDINIGKHCWIAYGAHILKGVALKSDVVVGTMSVVVNSIDESNVVVGGFPARILKKNINWDRDLPTGIM